MSSHVFPIAAGSSVSRWFCGILAALTLCLGLFLGFLTLYGPRTVALEVSSLGLRIRGDVYGRHIARESLRLAEARPLDRSSETEFRPVRRTNGIGLPTYQSGWFQLANGSKALLFVTDWNRAVLVPTTQGYTLIVSPADPEGFLAVLKQPPENQASIPMSEPPPWSASPVSWLLLLLGAFVPLAISGLLAYVAGSTRGVRFEISSEGLRIRGDLFGRTIPRGSLRLAEAEVLDLKAEPSRKPFLRTCGVGLPGYCSGWFRLKDRTKALVFLTDLSRSVSVPTTDGYTLLISPADPAGFLAALRS